MLQTSAVVSTAFRWIELAAARVNVLSAYELARTLDERFRILRTSDRSALPRHQTMRALIDWSYDLLSEDERRCLRKLSIFAGGFTLEAAAAVCGEGEIDEIAILELLSSLVDKSLVQADNVEDDARYSLLETTRQYAREKLTSAGEDETTAHAHAIAFFRLAQRLHDAFDQQDDRGWYARAELELENFRAALSWSFGSSGDTLLGQRLPGALRPVWFSFASIEGLRWLQTAQQRVTEETPEAIVAMLDFVEAALVALLGQHKTSLTLPERALMRYRGIGDERGIAEAELRIGTEQVHLGEIAEGQVLLERSLVWARSAGARRAVLSSLQMLAIACKRAADLPGARERFREALAFTQRMGADTFPAGILINLAELEFLDQNAVEALRLVNQAIAAEHAFENRVVIARARINSVAYLTALRRFDEARAAARDAMAAASDSQFSIGVTCALQHLAAVAALRPSTDALVREDRRRAARILGYVDVRLAAVEVSRQYTEQHEYDAMMPALRDALGDDELARLMTEGASWSEDQAIAEADVHLGISERAGAFADAGQTFRVAMREFAVPADIAISWLLVSR